jgi:hypothetical protein
MNDVGRHIRKQFADTGGFTDHVFAACAILGYRFALRSAICRPNGSMHSIHQPPRLIEGETEGRQLVEKIHLSSQATA